MRFIILVEDRSCDTNIIVFRSCSHFGINNIIKQAMIVTNEDRVIIIIGRFYLKKVNNYILDIIQYFKNNEIEKV